MKLAKKIVCLSLFLGFAAPSQAYDDIRTGVLSYYSFNTSTTNDSAFTNHFTAISSNGIPPSLVAGQMGTALSLGTNQYLRIDHDSNNVANGLPVYGAGAYSILMWVKGPPVSGRYLFAEGSTVSANPLLILQTGNTAPNSNKFDVVIRNDANVTLVSHVVSSNVVFDDTWHHIAWVDNNGNAKLYVDGNLDVANFKYVRSGTFAFNTTAIGTLIRAAVATANIYTNGPIDEVSLWERALNQSEVQQIMTNGIVTPVPALPAFITTHPANVKTNSQGTVTFSVAAAGTRPNTALTYQWYSNGIPILDAISSTYQIINPPTNYTGQQYSVAVSNVIGGELSSNAVLTVEDVPKITIQPQGSTNTQGSNLSLSVAVTGLPPFTYAWTRNGAPVGGNDNPLVLNNIQFSDAGEYRVMVSNAFGDALSDPATVVVNPRLAPPATIAVDFNDRANNTAALTLSGFLSFILDGAGAITTPTRRLLYNSIDLTVVGSGSALDSRLRTTPTNQVAFTESSILRDFVFAAASVNNGLDVQFDYLKTNQNYVVTVWCYDSGNGGFRESDWFANGTLAKQGYVFNGSIFPTNNSQSQFSFVAQANASGQLLIQGRQTTTSAGVSVFLNAIRLVETALGSLPPTITTEPQSVSTYVNAPVTLSVAASGTLPFTYAWQKAGVTIPGANTPTLSFPNVQFTNAGDYQVFISNLGGSATSMVATVTVSLRPPTPSAVRIDINNPGNETAVDTQDGFESFALKTIGAGPTTRTLPSGIEMTLGAAGGIAIETRLRTTPTNVNDFTEEKLLRDFVFSRDTNTTQGIDIALSYLKPGQQYEVTIWSYDSTSGGNNRVSDWTANGELVQEGYSFLGSTTVMPTSDDQYRFTFTVAADSEGKIVIQARKNSTALGDLNCFINALQVAEPAGLRITEIALNGGVRLTIQTASPLLPHRIDQTADIGSPSWSEVPGVTFSGPVGNLLQAQFAAPLDNRFYRAVLIPPQAIFADDFEGIDKGWTNGGTGNPPWEKGTPAVGQGPGTTHSGTNVWGVGLTTQYSANSDLWLRSPVINLTGVASASLVFWEFRSVDDLFAGTFVHYAVVRINDASNGSLIVELSKNAGKQTQWTKRSFLLPPEVLGKNVIVEFQLVSDSVTAPPDRHGWFIDDMTVLPE